MPDVIRVSGMRKSRSRRYGFLTSFAALAAVASSTVLNAQTTAPRGVLVEQEATIRGAFAEYAAAAIALSPHEIAALALTLGVVLFAVVVAILWVRARFRMVSLRSAARTEINALKAELERTRSLLFAEPQALIVWNAGTDVPDMMGEMSLTADAPGLDRILAFATWLAPDKAQAMQSAVAALRARGESFAMELTTLTGDHIEAEGRALGGRAIFRLKDVSGARRDYAGLAAAHAKLTREIENFTTLLDTLPSPVWTRDASGRLVWANATYARVVGARSGEEAVARGLELLDPGAREQAARAYAAGERFVACQSVIATGRASNFDVTETPTPGGRAGIGIDTTETEKMRGEIARMIEAHRRILDQLPTAVAVFAADQRLIFYNKPYSALWELEPRFLDQAPTDATILERLRAARKLPEEGDFRKWIGRLHEAYRAAKPSEHLWYLPTGRTLRVVAAPNPEGGITYLFDDISERYDLARRNFALEKVRNETLENLAEGVAVFGSDGKLSLVNSAFARMWRLSPSMLKDNPHVETLIGWCRPLHSDDTFWQSLRSAVTALDHRESMDPQRLTRGDGSVLECASLPLPDGATLVTFQDVTDSVNVEHALRERAEALEAADKLKNDFIHHVSYELRSPLTNIIGFSQLLEDPSTGPLTDKQHEYLGYIGVSSSALLAIINDILDLATIDAGAMRLSLGPVDIRHTMEAAAEGVRDRLGEKGITLEIKAPANIGIFTADERRVRQILYNLLSNAIGFSPPSETITLASERREGAVAFTVTDRGMGIPPAVVNRVFDRFQTFTQGSEHRGAGLGLSIVRSFVELHGGRVLIDTQESKGTKVSCIFPVEHVAARTAAE